MANEPKASYGGGEDSRTRAAVEEMKATLRQGGASERQASDKAREIARQYERKHDR